MTDRRTSAVTFRVRPTRPSVLVALLGAAAVVSGFVAPASATPPSQADKVTICHRTNSVTNPYTLNTVDVASVNGVDDDHGQGDHYVLHIGPVFDPAKQYQPPMKGDEWGDIIPPVEGVHLGLNWDAAGQAIWSNGCTPVTPPTTTATEPTTTTTEPSTTTTEPSTTTTEPSTTSTTEPSTTSTTEPSTTTATEPTTETPGTGATVPSSTTTQPVVPGETPEEGATVAPTTPKAPAQPEVGAVQGNAVPQAHTDGADLVGSSGGWTGLQSTLVGAGLLMVAAGGLMSVRREQADR